MHDESRTGAANAPATARRAGAGLYDHSAHDPFPRWSGPLVGLAALLLTAASAAALYMANPAFQAGKAFGTPDQLGRAVVAAGGPEAAAGGAAAEGQALVAAKGCTGCHVIPGSGGAAVGPNLGGVASRPKIAGGAVDNTGPEDLKRWIMDPPALKPGTGMPRLNLTEDEASKIAAFLATLK